MDSLHLWGIHILYILDFQVYDIFCGPHNLKNSLIAIYIFNTFNHRYIIIKCYYYHVNYYQSETNHRHLNFKKINLYFICQIIWYYCYLIILYHLFKLFFYPLLLIINYIYFQTIIVTYHHQNNNILRLKINIFFYHTILLAI